MSTCRAWFLALAALTLTACPTEPEPVDADRDGFTDDVDCDDANAAVNPSAQETCGNDLDDDCDGHVDDTGVGAQTWYEDRDGDGFGDAEGSFCEQPDGWVDNDDDCNDDDPTFNPSEADADCDGQDQNCSGQPDENAEGTLFYRDADGDGFGDAEVTTRACEAPAGWLADKTDCNDNDATVHPSAEETCDGIDENCDGEVDETVLGQTETCLVRTCLELKSKLPKLPDGDYWLEDGQGGAWHTACDMRTSSGGWTRITGEDIQRLDWDSDEVFDDFEIASSAGTHWSGSDLVLEPWREHPRPGDSLDRRTVVVRANIQLPFTFEQSFGSFDTTFSGWDDTDCDPGSALNNAGLTHGCVLFGGGEEVVKEGRTWGISHDHSLLSVEYPLGGSTFRRFKDPIDTLWWELNGFREEGSSAGPQQAELRVRDIELWVR